MNAALLRSLALGIGLFASACATLPDRAPSTAALQAGAQVPGYADIRFPSDASIEQLRPWRESMIADRATSGLDHDIELLAISSGSDKGAFSAGYLTGWTRAGDRPEFDVVVGVSTGAMIAPLAFLGSRYDATLKRIYTTIAARDIYRPTPVSGLLGGRSFASSSPLAEMIATEITPEMVVEIANQHRRGRRLLVMTTNLDSQRGTVWDIGAIAASGVPGREDLIERVLLASASIPSVFPPVLIEVQSAGRTFNEMHVDGGTTASVFAVPPALIWSGAGNEGAPAPGGAITILYNDRIAPQYKVTEPAAFAILVRALETMIGSADRTLIQTYREYAQRNGLDLDFVAIDEDFEGEEGADSFDTDYMNGLFAYGVTRAQEERAD